MFRKQTQLSTIKAAHYTALIRKQKLFPTKEHTSHSNFQEAKARCDERKHNTQQCSGIYRNVRRKSSTSHKNAQDTDPHIWSIRMPEQRKLTKKRKEHQRTCSKVKPSIILFAYTTETCHRTHTHTNTFQDTYNNHQLAGQKKQ